MRPVALAGILASTTILGGCAGTIAGVTLSSISSVAGLASTIFTGADLGEHAVSILTGKDCRFSEGLLRDDRDVCEEPGSLATRDDFHGIFVDRIEEDGTIVYAAPKFMRASISNSENNPDVVWAQIKEQKAKEENERQIARANAAQQIDVAALATGSLSSDSLAFLPGGVKVSTTDVIDGDTASQTAKSPRPVANNVVTVKVKAPVQAPTTVRVPTVLAAAAPVDAGQPAIDETTLTAPLKAAAATGEGGPFIATVTNTTPVYSKLVKGEPVVVLRIGPVFSANMQATSEMPTTVALPSEEAAPVASNEPVSALSAVMQAPVRQAPVFEKTALTTPKQAAPVVEEKPVVEKAALVEKKVEPRAKPVAPAPVAVVKKPKKVETTQSVVTNKPDDVDVYQPPLRESAGSLATSPAPDLTAAAAPATNIPSTTVMSTPIPDTPAPSHAAPASSAALTTEPNTPPMPAATSGPAALVQQQ